MFILYVDYLLFFILYSIWVIVVKHKEFVRSNNLQVKFEITWEFGHSSHEHIELNT